jgi:hypothetical protein
MTVSVDGTLKRNLPGAIQRQQNFSPRLSSRVKGGPQWQADDESPLTPVIFVILSEVVAFGIEN